MNRFSPITSRLAMDQVIFASPNRTVYISGFGTAITAQQLEETLNQFGPLQEISLGRNAPGFAYVTFVHSDGAANAIRTLDEKQINGHRVHLELAIVETHSFRQPVTESTEQATVFPRVLIPADFDHLPPELLTNVINKQLKDLSLKERLRLREVSKRWRDVIEDDLKKTTSSLGVSIQIHHRNGDEYGQNDLVLNRVKYFTNEFVHQIGGLFPALTQLTVDVPFWQCNLQVSQLLEPYHSTLQNLTFSLNNYADSSVLVGTLNAFTQLTTLNLVSLDQVNYLQLLELGPVLERLERLALKGNFVGNSIEAGKLIIGKLSDRCNDLELPASLLHWPNDNNFGGSVTRLNIRQADIRWLDLVITLRFRALQSLRIHFDQSRITTNIFRHLTRLRQLTELELVDFYFNRTDFRHPSVTDQRITSVRQLRLQLKRDGRNDFAGWQLCTILIGWFVGLERLTISCYGDWYPSIKRNLGEFPATFNVHLELITTQRSFDNLPKKLQQSIIRSACQKNLPVEKVIQLRSISQRWQTLLEEDMKKVTTLEVSLVRFSWPPEDEWEDNTAYRLHHFLQLVSRLYPSLIDLTVQVPLFGNHNLQPLFAPYNSTLKSLTVAIKSGIEVTLLVESINRLTSIASLTLLCEDDEGEYKCDQFLLLAPALARLERFTLKTKNLHLIPLGLPILDLLSDRCCYVELPCFIPRPNFYSGKILAVRCLRLTFDNYQQSADIFFDLLRLPQLTELHLLDLCLNNLFPSADEHEPLNSVKQLFWSIPRYSDIGNIIQCAWECNDLLNWFPSLEKFTIQCPNRQWFSYFKDTLEFLNTAHGIVLFRRHCGQSLTIFGEVCKK